MKTIDRAALEYISSNNIDFDPGKSAFKAGVEFAQQWISVKVEIPKNFEGNCSANVLLKHISGKEMIGYYDHSDKTFMYFNDIMEGYVNIIDEITHYRLIELR